MLPDVSGGQMNDVGGRDRTKIYEDRNVMKFPLGSGKLDIKQTIYT